MPYDPNTGLYVDEVYHTPGPGGNPLVGGLMDAYNAMQSNTLYEKKKASDALTRQLQMAQNPAIYEDIAGTNQGSAELDTLGTSPETASGIIQGAPAHKYQQALSAAAQSPGGLTPESVFSAAAMNDPAEMVKMFPMMRMTEQEQGRLTRERETQTSKQTQKFGDTYRQLFQYLTSKGVDPDKADQIAMSRASAAAPGLSDELMAKAKERAQSGVQLESGMLPEVEAQINKLSSQSDLNEQKVDQIAALTPAQKANLMASAEYKRAAAATAGIKSLIAKKNLGTSDLQMGLKQLTVLNSLLKTAQPSAGQTEMGMQMTDPAKYAWMQQMAPQLQQMIKGGLQKVQSSLPKNAILQENKQTGGYRLSLDGGNTWINFDANAEQPGQ